MDMIEDAETPAEGELTFEDALERLQELVARLEEGDVPLEESVQAYADGMRLVKTCLGRQWFHDHSSPLIRATRGMVYLQEMTTDEFYESCRELRKSVENY